MKNNNTIEISNKTMIFEIIAVLVTATGKFLFMDYLNWRFPFVVVAILFWFAYIFYRYKQNPKILNYWGFKTDNFKKVMFMVLPFGIIAVVIFLIVGYFQNTINLTWHIIPILILYPIWGTIQQFLMIGLISGNLRDLKIKKLNNTIIIFLTAILFASVHYPINWLIIGTFILAIFYGYIYLKNKNLYVLGLFHGWLGGIFYYTVLNTDPFLETFEKLL